MLNRIIKNGVALGTGQVIHVLIQLLTPPAFIAAYGVTGYGDWLALSAAVGYLTSLDFGLQTYVMNELIALYHRKEMVRFSLLQSVGFRLVLCLVLLGSGLAGALALLPVPQWLGMQDTGAATRWAIFLLGLQPLAGIVYGQFQIVYRIVGRAHVGTLWSNGQRLIFLVITLLLVAFKAPFWAIALGQLLSMVVAIPAVLIHIRASAPDAMPTLRGWSSELARSILKPSAMFGVLALNYFLIFQIPVMVLRRVLGANAVVSFSVARILFSFVRQASALVQNSIAPEVTRLNGLGDIASLRRVYAVCESLLLPITLLAHAGALLAAPLVLRLWLGGAELFQLDLFSLVMAASVMMTAKEFKLQFQYATNRHTRAAVMTFLSYVVLMAGLPYSVRTFGIGGFLVPWLVVEAIQTVGLHRENSRFLAEKDDLPLRSVGRLTGLLAVFLVCIQFLRDVMQSDEGPLQLVLVGVVTTVLGWGCSRAFPLDAAIRRCGQLLSRRRTRSQSRPAQTTASFPRMGESGQPHGTRPVQDKRVDAATQHTR